VSKNTANALGKVRIA